MLRMSFAQIYRAFKGARLKNEDEWRRARLVAWEVAYKNAKLRKSQEAYFPIGTKEVQWKPTQDYLDQYWQKYGTLTKKRKRNVQRN